MTVLIHTPYGSHHKESNLIYLISTYLKTLGLPIRQVVCNGMFSLCDRDEENGWRREIDSCLNCICNQKALAGWASVDSLEMSKYLDSEEVLLTRRMLNKLPADQLMKVRYANLNLYSVCKHSFLSRVGSNQADMANKRHEQLLRRYLLSAARMCLAVRRMLNTMRPDYTLLASGEDFITRAYCEQARGMKSPVILFKLDIHSRCIRLENITDGRCYNSPFFMSDVRTMRSDVSSWPRELFQVMQEVSEFLGVAEAQIALPLAQ